MTRDDITRIAREAGFVGFDGDNGSLRRFADLVAAAEREHMISDGWRQCAQGQRTSQHCAVAEQARRDEREACAGLCDSEATIEGIAQRCAAAIRARG
jgi:uncharacterized alpha-E superfamily protein